MITVTQSVHKNWVHYTGSTRTISTPAAPAFKAAVPSRYIQQRFKSQPRWLQLCLSQNWDIPWSASFPKNQSNMSNRKNPIGWELWFCTLQKTPKICSNGSNQVAIWCCPHPSVQWAPENSSTVPLWCIFGSQRKSWKLNGCWCSPLSYTPIGPWVDSLALLPRCGESNIYQCWAYGSRSVCESPRIEFAIACKETTCIVQNTPIPSHYTK